MAVAGALGAEAVCQMIARISSIRAGMSACAAVVAVREHVGAGTAAIAMRKTGRAVAYAAHTRLPRGTGVSANPAMIGVERKLHTEAVAACSRARHARLAKTRHLMFKKAAIFIFATSFPACAAVFVRVIDAFALAAQLFGRTPRHFAIVLTSIERGIGL